MKTEDFIFKVVQDFYDLVRTDILIGYHFRNIPDFDVHIPRIALFWNIQLLGLKASSVKPPFDLINLHSPLGIKRGELGRWILLIHKVMDKNLLDHPEHQELVNLWKIRIKFFEGVFSRFFSI